MHCKPLFVYIMGPYTSPDPVINVRSAVGAAEIVCRAGHIPFVPHLYHLWHLAHPHDYEFWTELALAWLSHCDCAIRLLGDSPGSDQEEAVMTAAGKPVYSLVQFAAQFPPHEEADA